MREYFMPTLIGAAVLGAIGLAVLLLICWLERVCEACDARTRNAEAVVVAIAPVFLVVAWCVGWLAMGGQG